MVSGGLLPIGRPIANTSLHVLDAADTPTPVGIIGELCIGGMGLARGYHQRDKLTAAKFVDIDIGSGLRERLYRTGDRARYRADGSLECLGRMDHQVKIRGFRIELGEIEHALGQHSGVDTCVVLADISAVAGARLVAFFTADKERLLSVDALRESLRQSLPDYMVPTLFVELSQMPLTPNGKIDRRSLIVPSSTDDFSGSGPTSPSRDSLELQLIEIWEDVLGISGVGVGDNFFDLGGHSLVAVRLMARITKQFGQQLPLATLFQGGNIEQLADILRAESSQQLWSSLVPVRRSGCKTPLFCVAGAGGNVVYFHDLARALDRERPFYALQPPGLDGRSAPLGKIEELAAHYIDSICSIQPHGPYMLLGHSFGGLVAFEMAHQLDRAGEEIERLLLLDTAAPHLQYPLVANWDEARWLVQIAAIAAHLYDADELVVDYNKLAALNSREQLEYLHGQLIVVGVLPPGSALEHFRGFVDVYKANLRAVYSGPKDALPARVTIFRSRDLQPGQLVAETADSVRSAPLLGWDRCVSGELDVKTVDGDHLTMMRVPQVKSLATAIDEKILTHP
jgi:thioesterase domain-containing protein/acyl carrier protein